MGLVTHIGNTILNKVAGQRMSNPQEITQHPVVQWTTG